MVIKKGSHKFSPRRRNLKTNSIKTSLILTIFFHSIENN